VVRRSLSCVPYAPFSFVTSKDSSEFFNKITDYVQVMKYEALSRTIHKQAKQRINYLKT
jgi:hypothetical protein